MNHQKLIEELNNVAQSIIDGVRDIEYYQKNYNLTVVVLIATSLECPDMDAAIEDGTIQKLIDAIESKKLVVCEKSEDSCTLKTYGTPNEVVFKTWDELVAFLDTPTV